MVRSLIIALFILFGIPIIVLVSFIFYLLVFVVHKLFTIIIIIALVYVLIKMSKE